LPRARAATVVIAVSQLLACPFCREIFDPKDAEHCPDCDIPLEPLHQLPPSYEVVEAEAARWEKNRPEHERLGAGHFGRGRGVLLAIALLSLLAFWLPPWVDVASPNAIRRSGLSLARGPLGFLWGGACAWLVSIGLILSRRTIAAMRGVRAILMALSAMTASEIVVLLVMSPSASRNVHVMYEWAWGLDVALALSVLGVVVAARFGGAVPEVRPAPRPPVITERPTSTLH